MHQRSVTAWCLAPGPGGRPTKVVRTFATMTDGLLARGDWLAAAGVTHVALESTGGYWKPVWNLLEERLTLLLVTAQHVKAAGVTHVALESTGGTGSRSGTCWRSA